MNMANLYLVLFLFFFFPGADSAEREKKEGHVGACACYQLLPLALTPICPVLPQYHSSVGVYLLHCFWSFWIFWKMIVVKWNE